ncbi:hypothetical protein [Microbispora bryophytorum]|uniref:hypothetical protein n=1 Tax=Microbispora bryophytorum TaxID=1460882 RepID=UPI0033D8ABB1
MSGRDLPGEQAGEQAGLARFVLRPMGSPLPLGFLGLALATTAFAAVELGWVPGAQARVVAAALGVVLLTAAGTAARAGFRLHGRG